MGKYFSTVEIGKARTYEQLRRWFGNLKIIEGIDMANIRAEYGARKSSEKREKSVFSHAIDAVVIASKRTWIGGLKNTFFLRMEALSISEKTNT